jgi:hypothetical protein
MTIRFKHGGEVFTTDTPEEAVKLRALLKRQDVERTVEIARKRVLNELKFHGEGIGALDALTEVDVLQNPWTPEVFLRLIERLGVPQKAALSLLVTRHHVTDEELREALKVPGNQALAGVLSGISKQAAALNIPARAIFSLENLRNAGKRRSTYTIADKFLQIASDMNWPSTPQE